ncbi:unnamed protein product [Strongylus vulgaris]|uniref:Uncharacterized protein n=1 Tax=Strongylus vulgaris TaxID=40348 RepID=A0A3P7KX52_STRVU|nr:unnamed protein product [Strongylus vulgaris]
MYNQTVNTVRKGWCEVSCQKTQIIFFSLFAFLAVSVFALAPLIQSAAMRLGSIPGAVLFGAVIDTTCMHWSTGCDGSMKCVLYNAEKLGFYIFLFTIIIKVFCFFCLFVAYKSYIPIANDVVECQKQQKALKPVSKAKATTPVIDVIKSTAL